MKTAKLFWKKEPNNSTNFVSLSHNDNFSNSGMQLGIKVQQFLKFNMEFIFVFLNNILCDKMFKKKKEKPTAIIFGKKYPTHLSTASLSLESLTFTLVLK